MKIVILDSFSVNPGDLDFSVFSDFGNVLSYDRTPFELTVERIGDAEIVLSNKTAIDKSVIDSCKNLKYIGLFATGYNIVDVEYAREKGIVVCNVPDYSSKAVAQHTFALILEFYSKIWEHNDLVKKGNWSNCSDFCFYSQGLSELNNKTIGLIGFGNISKQVEKIATAFDMNVLVYSRTIKKEFEKDNLKFVDLDYLFKNSDIISIHCPLFEETKNLINKETLNKMKKTAILINTSRGPIINDIDLACALNSEVISGAGLDVVSIEPILANNPLLDAKNCIITPHIAWAPKETRDRLIKVVVQNIKDFLNDTPNNMV